MNSEFKNKNIVTIDPGIGGTALICWRNEKISDVFTITSPKDKINNTWEKRVEHLFIGFENYLKRLNKYLGKIDKIIMEKPYTAFSGRKSVVANEKQTIVKLSLLTGGLWSISKKFTKNFEFLEVQKWKGQLDKEKTKNRVSKTLFNKKRDMSHKDLVMNLLYFPLNDHEYDAIGMGLFKMGLF